MLRLASALAFLVLGACSSPKPLGPRPEGTGTVIVHVEEFDDMEGQVLINVFTDRDGFPSDYDEAFEGIIVSPIEGDPVTETFTDLPAGPIAISVLHDVDEDFELETSFLGIPQEDWGVSNNASRFMAAPTFDQARVDLESGQTVELHIKLRRR